MGNLSWLVSQNLHYKQNLEFETFLCQVRIVKSGENNRNGKMIGFADFSGFYNFFFKLLDRSEKIHEKMHIISCYNALMTENTQYKVFPL